MMLTVASDMNPLELMPPSVFESSSQSKNVKTQEDPWQEVARAKEEFNKLKQEIENLRYKPCTVINMPK